MKNLSSSVTKSNSQITAKLLAKTLNRAVKTGVKAFGTGLKIGAAAAIGAGALAACESSPAPQIIATYEGPVVRYYEGTIGKDNVPTTYFVVKTNGNPSERHIAILNEIAVNPPYSKLYNNGTTVRFRWSDNNGCNFFFGATRRR